MEREKLQVEKVLLKPSQNSCSLMWYRAR